MALYTEKEILNISWQAFERLISRLLVCSGYQNVRMVGGSGDHGADLLAQKNGKRWLFQAKQWKKPIGTNVIKETLDALHDYRAEIPVIVSSRGFETEVKTQQKILFSQGIPLQLWDAAELTKRLNKLEDKILNKKEPRKYQESAIQSIVQAFVNENENNALIVLATGLGKTFVSAEAIRRINLIKQNRTLVLAHTNPLVYQLEKSFWPFLKPSETTLVWNGYEHPSPSLLETSNFVFACADTVQEALKRNISYPFDIILVDECHHAGSTTYREILDFYDAGKTGAFLIGLTATPWRQDEHDIRDYFGEEKITIDMIYGMKNGFLSNVDYRMYTDNIKWDVIKDINGKSLNPKQINRTLFITQWDDGVIIELQKAWKEQANPRAIVFCGTIDHAITMRDRINAMGFCKASAIFSQNKNQTETQSMFERNKILCDFGDGLIQVICTVDVFNEGIDVPDVNIIVFQRVTHSRRIFIQQLGRGLRISDDKDKVIVLDFVSDIRRFAAGLDLKDKLEDKNVKRVSLPNKVQFRKVGSEDPKTETFLRQWLEDVADIENKSDEQQIKLKYVPDFE